MRTPKKVGILLYVTLSDVARLFLPQIPQSWQTRLRRYTRLTSEIRNSGLMDSSVCGYRGEALLTSD